MNQIDAVVARLVSKEYLLSLLATSHNYCGKQHKAKGYTCTQEAGHTGFHVAHFPVSKRLVDAVEPWGDEDCLTIEINDGPLDFLKVMVRLLSRTDMGTMFRHPTDGISCNMEGPRGMYGCTRPVNHSGLHVAHVSATECCAVWLDDFYHEYK